jgi:hypothetical protein
VEAKESALIEAYQRANHTIYDDNEKQIAGIEENISVMVQLVSLGLMVKLHKTFSAKTTKTLTFLSSFLFKDDKAISAIVQEILRNHNKDEIYILYLKCQLAKSYQSS